MAMRVAGWYKLPQEIKEEILALLPVDCLCRSRGVCNEWNNIVSSARFITSEWAKNPSNKNPWLVFVNNGFSAYSFSTRTWKTLMSFSSFLPEARKIVKCWGSAQGLFLVEFPGGTFTVCNPLTQSFINLPVMSCITKVFNTAIVGSKLDTDQNYKVVAVGLSRGSDVQIVEIYDSEKKSWKVAGYLPQEFQLPFPNPYLYGRWNDYPRYPRMVFKDEYFLCTISTGKGFLGFNIKNEIISIVDCQNISDSNPHKQLQTTLERPQTTFTPLPNSADGSVVYPKLLTCESRLLLAGAIVRGSWLSREIVEVMLWEFHKDSPSSSSWEEIARMPRPMCKDFQDIIRVPFDCVGVGDQVCFKICPKGYAAVYHLSEKTWSWLPTAVTIEGVWGYVTMMAFTPRPDMKNL